MAVSIDGFNLPTVEIVKDLGVFMSNDMKFSHHVHKIYCKAVQKSNLIYKSFISREIKFLVSMFKTYVRCIVENNTSVWSPYLLSDINKIERVQRKFTKRIPGFSNICYEERLNILCLTTLELRRLHFDLILVYKIINKLVDIDFDTFFQFSNSNTRGNSLKLFLPSRERPEFRFRFRLFSFRFRFRLHFEEPEPEQIFRPNNPSKRLIFIQYSKVWDCSEILVRFGNCKETSNLHLRVQKMTNFRIKNCF